MPPLTLLIKPVSGACNMRCDYCFYADVSSHRQVHDLGKMDRDTMEALIRRALSYAEGSLSFAFQGGEPTLAGVDYFEAFSDCVRRLNRKKTPVSYALQTNAYRIDPPLLSWIAREKCLVGVSLDGPIALHDAHRRVRGGDGTYDAIQQTIQSLRDAGIEYNILSVVHRETARMAEAVFRELEGHGYLQFIPMIDDFVRENTDKPFSNDTENGDLLVKDALEGLSASDDYLNFLKTTFDMYYAAFESGHPVSIRTFDNYISILMGHPPENCAMAGRCGAYLTIEADGSAYPCDFYVLDDYRLGNIRDHSIPSLFATPAMKAFRAASYNLPTECRACKWYNLCRGGCRRDREPVVDGVPALNRFCETHRAFFEHTVERMRRMAGSLSQ